MSPSADRDARVPMTAFVSGGAKRLGKAMALELARKGFDVAVHFNASAREAESTASEIEAIGRRAALVRAEHRDLDALGASLDEAARQLGPVGVLVNNASIFEHDTLATMTADRFERHMDINLKAPAFLCQAFASALPADHYGLIVNLIDARVSNLTPNLLSYSLSKYGLWGLTQILARDLAPRIRVNGIAPGAALPAPQWDQAGHDRFTDRLPLRRGTNPHEIARALAYLLDTPSVTGQLLTLDGGQQMGWLPPTPSREQP